MADVKRSVVITAQHDGFIDRAAARLDRNRSWVVRYALDRLMTDPAFFSDTAPNQSDSDAHQKQKAVPA